MKKFLLVLVFAVSFVLKAATVFGVEKKQPTKQPVEVKSEVSSEDGEDRSSEMKIQNNITFGQVSNPGTSAELGSAKGTSLSHQSATELKQSSSTVGISLTPMVGGTVYQGRWNSHIRNNYTLGVAVELSIIPLLSLEAEVGQGRYYISYSNYGHNFTQYTYGGTAKFYLTRGLVQTYLGGGILGITYQNMTYGVDSMTTYDRTIGAGQAVAGAEIALSSQVALGARGSYIVPLFNRPQVMSSGGIAYQGFEESSAMDTAMLRMMGTLKISL